MTLTERGLEVYQGLELVMNQLLGMHQIEKEMTQYFGIQRCIVVAGDSDIQKKVLSDFGDVLTNTLNLLYQMVRIQLRLWVGQQWPWWPKIWDH